MGRALFLSLIIPKSEGVVNAFLKGKKLEFFDKKR